MTEGMPAEPIPFRVLLDEAMKKTRVHFGKMYLPVAIPLTLLAGAVAVVQTRFVQNVAVSGAGMNPLAAAGGCIGFLLVLFVFLALTILSNAVLTVAALDGSTGRPISMNEKWRFVLQPSVIGTLIMALVAIFIGFCLFIIPGIYLFLRLSFLVPVMASEGLRGMDAMRRSWELVKYSPHKRFLDNTGTKIFLLYLVAGIISGLVSMVVQLPFTAMRGFSAMRDISTGTDGAVRITGGGRSWLEVPSQMLGQLVSTAVAIYASFGLVLLFLDVMRRKEGKDLASAIEARFGGGAPPPAPLNPPA